ncbi:MAG: hypothetical protein EOO99_00600 [Pedobacter sp.]|nr:MAG: hypothetical protein EOO99_00600 [Pedobacter sp.]
MSIVLEKGMVKISLEKEKSLCGGCCEHDKNLFYAAGELLGNIVKGFIIFGSEVGKSAGLTVK